MLHIHLCNKLLCVYFILLKLILEPEGKLELSFSYKINKRNKAQGHKVTHIRLPNKLMAGQKLQSVHIYGELVTL